MSRSDFGVPKTHGHVTRGTKTPEYSSWLSMHSRCRNPKLKEYPNYGGRGISVCERWQRFENFLADMGPRPAGTTIDRIDNNGNYEPGNCRWTSRKVQLRNTRRTIMVGGVCLKDACAQRGFSYHAARYRIQSGTPVDRIFDAPLQVDMKIGPERISLRRACKNAGISYGTVKTRISRGWTIENALNTEPDKRHSRKEGHRCQ